jgi:hypothetical protein
MSVAPDSADKEAAPAMMKRETRELAKSGPHVVTTVSNDSDEDLNYYKDCFFFFLSLFRCVY